MGKKTELEGNLTKLNQIRVYIFESSIIFLKIGRMKVTFGNILIILKIINKTF